MKTETVSQWIASAEKGTVTLSLAASHMIRGKISERDFYRIVDTFERNTSVPLVIIPFPNPKPDPNEPA